MISYDSWKVFPIWKKVSVVVLAFFVLVFLAAFLRSVLSGVMSNTTGMPAPFSGNSVSEIEMYSSKGGNLDAVSYEEVPRATTRMTSLDYAQTTGADAEMYESLSYSATYKKRNHESTCATIESWKPLSYVVFERSHRGKGRCSFGFKVERVEAEGVVELLKSLVPEEFSTSISSLKKQVVEYDSQLAVLKRREEVLRSTLDDAVSAYAELTELATRTENVESLTKVVNDKLVMIERLTKERVALSREIDVLARNSAEVEDRIAYVRFDVSVTQYRVFDFARIKDSWERKAQQFVYTVNYTLQDMTIGLLATLFVFLLWVIYIFMFGFLSLVIVKSAWRFAREYWKSGNVSQ